MIEKEGNKLKTKYKRNHPKFQAAKMFQNKREKKEYWFTASKPPANIDSLPPHLQLIFHFKKNWKLPNVRKIKNFVKEKNPNVKMINGLSM